MPDTKQFTTPEEYLKTLPPDQQSEARAVYAFINETCPGLEEHMYSNIIGFGRDDQGWMLLGMCARKGYTAVYANVATLDKYSDQLGKVRNGKSCLGYKKFDKADKDLLRTILQEAIAKASMQA